MTDGLRQRWMPSLLPTHHHYEKRPPSGAPHEKITVWNTQVPRKLRSLARFRSVRPRNNSDSRRTWPAYGVRDHSRQASPLPPRSDIPVAGCALQNIAAAIVSRLSTDGSFVCLFVPHVTLNESDYSDCLFFAGSLVSLWHTYLPARNRTFQGKPYSKDID